MEFSSSSKRQSDIPKPREGEKDECDKTYQKYKERILALPVWTDHPPLDRQAHQYQNFWFMDGLLERVMFVQEHFKAQPSDIILSSVPKSGTTWLKALTFAIMTRNHFDDSTNPLLTMNPHDCVPFLEVDIARNLPNRHVQHPLISTHIPYTCLPESIIASACKIIYICRDPKDAFVSLLYFIWKLIPMESEPITIEKAFEQFCEGLSFYGPYWDHVLEYRKASLERPDKILFLKYEDLKRDTLSNVNTLAAFMGQPFFVEEEKEGVAEKIIRLCSFENLSNLEVNKSGKHRPGASIAMNNNSYFRKGKVVESDKVLTPEMIERLDRITEEKLKGSGLTFNISSA